MLARWADVAALPRAVPVTALRMSACERGVMGVGDLLQGLQLVASWIHAGTLTGMCMSTHELAQHESPHLERLTSRCARPCRLRVNTSAWLLASLWPGSQQVGGPASRQSMGPALRHVGVQAAFVGCERRAGLHAGKCTHLLEATQPLPIVCIMDCPKLLRVLQHRGHAMACASPRSSNRSGHKFWAWTQHRRWANCWTNAIGSSAPGFCAGSWGPTHTRAHSDSQLQELQLRPCPGAEPSLNPLPALSL